MLWPTAKTVSHSSRSVSERLQSFADRYGAGAAPDDFGDSPGMVEALRRKGAQALGRTEASGLLLLRDLRQLYLTAHDAEITWVMLAQAARAVRDAELIDLARECCEEAAGRVKWIRSKIKEASPQALAAG
ncbi:MAG TPA: hypothetical protein VFR67_16910 [Pilimelia sp.]|nr:hypothetical protein [Pilimelia sp.]